MEKTRFGNQQKAPHVGPKKGPVLKGEPSQREKTPFFGKKPPKRKVPLKKI